MDNLDHKQEAYAGNVSGIKFLKPELTKPANIMQFVGTIDDNYRGVNMQFMSMCIYNYSSYSKLSLFRVLLCEWSGWNT